MGFEKRPHQGSDEAAERRRNKHQLPPSGFHKPAAFQAHRGNNQRFQGYGNYREQQDSATRRRYKRADGAGYRPQDTKTRRAAVFAAGHLCRDKGAAQHDRAEGDRVQQARYYRSMVIFSGQRIRGQGIEQLGRRNKTHQDRLSANLPEPETLFRRRLEPRRTTQGELAGIAVIGEKNGNNRGADNKTGAYMVSRMR